MAPATTTRDRVRRAKENTTQLSAKQAGIGTSKRVTRSQSRDLGDNDSDVLSQHLRAPRGREPSLELGDAKEDSGAEISRRSGGTKRKRQKSPVSKLSAVAEESPRKSHRRDSPASIPETADGHHFDQDAADDHANISGTTILVNDSFDATENLDPDLMLEALPVLLHTSTNLLNFLTPSKSSEEKLAEWISHLQQGHQTPREQLQLTRRISVFESNKNCFGSHNYIDIPSVVRTFTSNAEDFLHQNPGLGNVLRKANLAALASNIVRSTEREALSKLLPDLSSSFPLPFMGPISKQASVELTSAEMKFQEETFKLTLDIRTQCIISSLKSQSAQDSLDQQRIEDHFVECCGNLLPDSFKDEIRSRTETIQESLSKDSETGAALHKLRETFPLKPFATQLALWIRLRTESIDRELCSQDNLDDLIDSLQAELDRQKEDGESSKSSTPPQQQEDGSVDGDHINGDASQGRSPPLSESEVSQRTLNWAMLNAPSMRLLKQRESKKDEISAELNGTGRTTASSDSWETCSSEPETEQQTPARASVGQTEKRVNGRIATRKRKAGNSGPAFIDPQENAQKVSPITLEDSAHRQKRRKRLPELSDVEEAGDDSESEAYQQDERHVDIEQNKKRKPKLKPGAPEKQRAPSENLRGDSGKRRRDGHEKGRDKSVNAVPLSPSPDGSGDDEEGPEEHSDDQGTQEEEKRDRAARTKERKEPKQQTRRRWTEDEARRLIKLIGKFGTSWALIKQKDAAYAERGGEPKLSGRNQVQLKDKARNMVLDFYKTGRQLPKNFDKVPISQKHKEQLAQLGVEYP